MYIQYSHCSFLRRLWESPLTSRALGSHRPRRILVIPNTARVMLRAEGLKLTGSWNDSALEGTITGDRVGVLNSRRRPFGCRVL